MTGLSWDFEQPALDPIHQETLEKVRAAMSTGHRGKAADLLEEYGREHPQLAESMRLSLVRDFGTGL